MDPVEALYEMQRVLCDGGKIYFIEHVRETKKFTSMWFLQVRYRNASGFIFIAVRRET